MKKNSSLASPVQKKRCAYTAPVFNEITVEVESGFAVSVEITGPDSTPQIKGLDNWSDWE